MMNNRMLVAIVFLSFFVTRTHTRDFRAQTFIEGSDVILKCDSPKVNWNEIIYIIWNISLQSKKCWLGIESSIQNSTCNDGKKLFNSSDGIYLLIPKISKEDEGSYLCDLSYKGGGYGQMVNLSVHHFTNWLEVINGQRVAVCQAKYEQSKPTLQWEPALNFSSNISNTRNGDMSFIVENRVYLPDNFTISNLTCVVTYPPSLAQRNLTNLETITIAVCSICFILVFVAVVHILHKKLNNLSALKTMCCKSKISTPAEEKPPQPPDVEELEPYASYIQRVNSIYNSSAELFNA
ncbi:cell surface glycoprotein CD200 receptor 1-A-like isoform X1 [Triplophysa dalaica]|uniref:cell surface glycoprotein CD200 receptor 1-A-like isoform X1 n=1 Tax=Triplophysa dalaica TaxID=1582913 RepID=UPI0024E00E56|nr:cell surface glycoprotein CD200 receptor 1-A-like isoform X1 [Triplophysa dalaica]